MATRDEVMKSRGEAYAEMEAHVDTFLAEIVDSPDVDTNILLTLFGLSREAEVRTEIADRLGALPFMSNDSLLGNLRKYIDELRGKNNG